MPSSESTMQCPACGAVYPLDSKFCRVDGTPLVAATSGATPPRPVPAPQTVRDHTGASGGNKNISGVLVAVVIVALVAAAGAGYLFYQSRATTVPEAHQDAGAASEAGGRRGGDQAGDASGSGRTDARDASGERLGTPARSGSSAPRNGSSFLEASGTMTRVTGEIMTDLSKGRENTLLGKGLALGGGINTAVGSTVEGVARGETSSSELAPGNLSRRAAQGVRETESESEQPQGASAADRSRTGVRAPARRCGKPACFEIFDAEIEPAAARPGQSVHCTARYTFSHNEGGTHPLQVEESVSIGIRRSRGESRRVDVGPGPNHFDLSFKVPDRTGAGTYPVTISVRRRGVTESAELRLVVVD